jgi:hypothetical protein
MDGKWRQSRWRIDLHIHFTPLAASGQVSGHTRNEILPRGLLPEARRKVFAKIQIPPAGAREEQEKAPAGIQSSLGAEAFPEQPTTASSAKFYLPT